MTSIGIEEFVDDLCEISPHTLDDYEAERPRWCKGCGDHGVLLAMQRLLRDEDVDPENVVAVSGIGCSSRLPHYLKTYGFHGVHGRALPISLGVALARPELRVLTVMGDGDCFSIGAGHWLHTVRYNPNIVVLVLDNEIYALTKKQASPTSPAGTISNTTPHGAYLKGLNPLSVIMGITNVSFLAQTSTWQPVHMEDTLRRAWAHKGMAFVRVLQRCPVYMPDHFAGGRNYPLMFLDSDDGIPVDRRAARQAAVQRHDPHDVHAAQRVAWQEDPAPMGLIYWNPEVPTYQEVRTAPVRKLEPEGLVTALSEYLDRYTVQLES